MPAFWARCLLLTAAAFASVAPQLGHAQERVTPWQFGARAGDCTADASAALEHAAAEAVRRSAELWTGDSCLAIGATFVPPPGLVWRSDLSDAHRLIWTGPRRSTGKTKAPGSNSQIQIISFGERSLMTVPENSV